MVVFLCNGCFVVQNPCACCFPCLVVAPCQIYCFSSRYMYRYTQLSRSLCSTKSLLVAILFLMFAAPRNNQLFFLCTGCFAFKIRVRAVSRVFSYPFLLDWRRSKKIKKFKKKNNDNRWCCFCQRERGRSARVFKTTRNLLPTLSLFHQYHRRKNHFNPLFF